jgi:TolB-like protein/DNA-binding winged helix-turn-helix (wHTH) protein
VARFVAETVLDYRQFATLGVVVSPQNASVCHFGVFELDLRAGELRKNGVKLRLQEQPYQVLLKLIEHHGEIVSREELRSTLWHEDTFVDFETGLNTAIKRLRETLGDSADNPTFIETLPRRGYKFIASVERPVGKGYNRVFVTALVLVVVLAVVFGFDLGGLRRRLVGEPSAPMIQSIAVLPLVNLSNDPEQEYFADGMTDDLITKLAQISALRVISRTSAMRYKGTKKSVSEIARELHVDAVVEGAVMRAGDRVRISAQLIEAPTDHHLWAASYERDLRGVLFVQDEVTRAIVSEIRVKLTPQEQARLASTHPINPEAFQLYLKGRYYWYKLNPEALQKATAYLPAGLG